MLNERHIEEKGRLTVVVHGSGEKKTGFKKCCNA